MATKTAFTPVHYGGRGAIDEFAIKVVGLVGVTAAGQADSFENPFGEDMLILRAFVAITTLDSDDADMDVGLADDENGTNKGNEIVDSMVHSATAIHEYLIHTIAVTGVSPLIWKAANATNTAVNSWISCWQNGSSDSSDLRYNLILIVARESDYQ